MEGLEEAIRVSRQAVQVTPDGHPDLARLLGNLGNVLACRYERTGRMEHLEEAILVSRQAVQATPNRHPGLVRLLEILGIVLVSRYERIGQMEDLEEAIRVSRQAVYATPDGHHNLAQLWIDLGVVLVHRYDRKGRREDLEEAIRISRQAIQATPDDHLDAGWLSSLGVMLGRRYKHTRQIEDLEEAVRVSRRAVQATPDDHPDLAGRLSNLGNRLGARYERTGKLEDLEEAIRLSRQAVQATPNDHHALAGRLSSLGNRLGARYKRKGQLEDLEEAIRLSRQAVQATPDDHHDLAGRLSNLGNRLTSRYEQKGGIEDLEEAIEVSRQAVKMTLPEHPELAGLSGVLAELLISRYERKGGIEDLDEAIWVSRRAIQAITNEHINFAEISNSLGNALIARYERTARTEDLEEAICVTRRAIQATPSDHIEFAGQMGSLGYVLISRYDRLGLIEDLEEAIRVFRQVVQATPNDHTDLSLWLNNLGRALTSRYNRLRQIEDLEEAIQISRRAFQATPDYHIRFTGCLSNLGNGLASRYERTREIEDLEEAIGVFRQAVQASPDNHSDLSMCFNNLGNVLESRYEQKRRMEDLEEAIRVSRQGFTITSAPPLTRIKAAIQALRLLIKREDYHGGYTTSVDAISLLSLVHKRYLSLQDQQYVVSHFSGFATHACSLALQTGQPLFKALQLLETGRNVILGLLMDDRSDTSQLREAHPALCELYESLLLEVNTPVESTRSRRTDEPISGRRPKAFKELEKCIQDIRQLPGFGSFQQGLTAEQMENASNNGNVIAVNVTSLRSDAIIISSVGLRLVPLPRFGAGQAQSWLDQKLTSASPSERGVKNKAYRQFLAWLWRDCVNPVLTELGHSIQFSPESLPRVWWIGTGLATSFPFHAACDVSAGPNENTFCRVLSSYTPSVRALLHARERVSTSPSSNERPLKVLMVTMTSTPGADDLPGVKAEMATVVGVLGNSVHVKILDQPDSTSVMRHIRECNIAHFACHGISNSLDPSQSGLLLQTATAIPRQDILSVLKLCENHPARGEIAYLSACSTAENQAKHLMDEVIHVVSGFQVAGFKHVIGTLWPSDDDVCVEVARSFYGELCQNGNLEYTERTVAMALHKAVSVISTSADYWKRPLLWAQYVHYGA